MREHDRDNIINIISVAIPGTTVTFRGITREKLRALLPYQDEMNHAGYVWRDPVFEIWMNVDSDDAYLFSVTREAIPLSSRERVFLGHLAEAIGTINPRLGETDEQQFRRLSARAVLNTAIAAKFLHNRKDRGFWNPAHLLLTLQELSSQNYEGGTVTSGFLVVSKEQDLESREILRDYEIKRFKNPIRLRDNFFSEPVSYRYIDGRNAFYLINRASDVFGFVRLRNPLSWSIADRSVGNHLKPFLTRMRGKSWAAIVGNHRDIQVITRLGPELRWCRNKWQYIHVEMIVNYIAKFVKDKDTANLIFVISWTLSIMRVGSLILLPRGDSRPHVIANSIDNDVQSEIGKAIEGQLIDDLVRGAGLFGILGSDGLTTITRNGEIESSGKIVALTVAAQAEAGGGRTQAAISSSTHGLAIKVSEDGPISLFLDGRRVFKTGG